MKKYILSFACLALSCSVLILFPGTASALNYPDRPIRIIVPFAPGGGNDVRARIVASKLTESWKQQVIVDNKPGADGAVGMELAAKAAPDGYTMIVGTTGSLTVTPSLYTNLRYDPVKDFAPITQLTTGAIMMLVNTALPVRSVKELIALAKANPGKLNYGSPSSPFYLAMEMFKSRAGVDIAYIPYKGSAPSVTALISGEVAVILDSALTSAPLAKSGRARAIAICSAKRASAMPDMPTVAESGLPGFEASNFAALLAPAKTPKEIVQKLNGEIVRILRMPDVRNRFANTGDEIVGSTPAELSAYIKAELEKYAKVIKASGIPRIE